MRLLALLLTTLTGFSGLVYEVTWQKYLATLLGSHSEATSAVLAIFLGGLSVGYALFGALTRRWVARAEEEGEPPRLLFTYGLLEGGIGIYAFLFPFLLLLSIFLNRLPVVLVVLDLLIQLDRLAVEVPPKRVENNPRHVIRMLDAFLVEPPRQPRTTP